MAELQGILFPFLTEELWPLTAKQQELVAILELLRIQEFILCSRGFPGRPREYRTNYELCRVAVLKRNK